MIYLFGFLLILLPVLANGNFRIVGGEITDITQVPYQAGLYHKIKESLICGGVIISEVAVITAAHCFDPKDPEKGVIVTVGSNSYKPNDDTSYKAKKIYIHKDYDIEEYANDIAVVYIDGQFVYSDSVKRAKLPQQNDFLEEGTEGRISGWGSTHHEIETASEELKGGHIKITNREQCDDIGLRMHGSQKSFFCAAADRFESNICSGDSGGGFVTDDNVVYGIVAWSFACGHHKMPSGFTRVGYYLGFIADTYANFFYG